MRRSGSGIWTAALPRSRQQAKSFWGEGWRGAATAAPRRHVSSTAMDARASIPLEFVVTRREESDPASVVNKHARPGSGATGRSGNQRHRQIQRSPARPVWLYVSLHWPHSQPDWAMGRTVWHLYKTGWNRIWRHSLWSCSASVGDVLHLPGARCKRDDPRWRDLQRLGDRAIRVRKLPHQVGQVFDA
jgi:hypothetical protein